MDTIRLNKFIADCGIVSRRKADALIEDGKVKINGVVVKELGVKIDPLKDRVIVAGKVLAYDTAKVYILLNKPKGVTSTTADPHAEKTVLDVVDTDERVYPVGRLDRESHGLVLLTNDGELANRLTHPRYHVPKKYRVVLSGQTSEYKLNRLRTGVFLDDGKTAPAEVSVIGSTDKNTVLELTLFEGKKREIRRMCVALHLHLLDLQRVMFGMLTLKDLPEGKSRPLRLDEVKALQLAVGLA
jgi:pseudouridine synthase